MLICKNTLNGIVLLKHTGFEKSVQDVLFDKSAFSPGQLESICELLPKLGTALDKMAPGIWNKVFFELIMRAFPCSSQVPSAFLLSSILSIKGIIYVLYGLLKVIQAKEITTMQAEVRFEILESILSVKTDRVFNSLHGQCDAIYGSMADSLEGLDYKSFFSMKNMYEFLRDINAREVVDSSVDSSVKRTHGYLVNNVEQDNESGRLFDVDVSQRWDEEGPIDGSIIGKVFDTPDDAYTFYNQYGLTHGFGIRKHWDYKNKRNKTCYTCIVVLFW